MSFINNTKDNFTITPNAILNCKTISLGGKGLYSFLLSKPTGWNFCYDGMAFQLMESEKVIRKYVKELADNNLLLRVAIREGNKFNGWKWIINPTEEQLQTFTDPTHLGTTHLGTTHLGTTHLGTTHLGTTHLGTTQNRNYPNGKEISKTNLSNTDLSNTELSSLPIGKEGDKPTKRKRFTPPTLDEIKEYCQESGLKINCEALHDHYQANGWKQKGGNGIKDWKATVRGWARREKDFAPKQSSTGITGSYNGAGAQKGRVAALGGPRW